MKAILWIHDRVCRVLLQDSEGRTIDMNDDWNNRASAESMVYSSYPDADLKFVQNKDKVDVLNQEWNACMGN